MASPDRKVARRAARRLVAVFGVMAVITACWFTGLFGRVLTAWVLPLILPVQVGDSVELLSLKGAGALQLEHKGAMLAVSEERLRQILREAYPASRYLPPGLLRTGMAIEGNILGKALDMPPEERIPFAVVLRDTAAGRPRFELRYPAHDLNSLTKELFGDDLREREEYLLGHYDLVYEIELSEFVLSSDDGSMDAEERIFPFRARGKARVTLEENLVTVRATGSVSDLSGQVVLRPLREEDGIALTYDVDITNLDVNFHRVNSLLDSLGADKLRRSLERSLNKEKKKRKLAKRRLPGWVPLDLSIDVRLTVPADK